MRRGGRTTTVLYDAGLSPFGVRDNMRRLGIDPRDIEALVMSHGHFDHTGGLGDALERDQPAKVIGEVDEGRNQRGGRGGRDRPLGSRGDAREAPCRARSRPCSASRRRTAPDVGSAALPV